MRKDITPLAVPEKVSTYIWRKIEPFETVLDFGCGDGRLAPIFAGKTVTGYDIVERTYPFRFTKELRDEHEVVVASKVFLHIPPAELPDTITALKMLSKRIVVWDAEGVKAPHCFDHNFSKFGEMQDVKRWDKELLFYWE